jgi:2-polyprenyl-6-methoxyphenol hydroxylase-like FAD-dependent oxidoreductase
MHGSAVGHVLVVGSGIAGAATAIALSRQGIEVKIVERDLTFDSNGSGITLMAPALRVLRDLGLLEECLARGYGVSELVTATADGEVLDTVNLPHLLGPELPSIAGMYRPDLLSILRQAAIDAGATLSVGTTLTGLELQGQSVQVSYSTGPMESYDLVIGADGWLSPLRNLLWGDEAPAPTFLGQAVWRAVVPRSEDATRSTFLYAAKRKAGYMPISPDRMYAYVVEPTANRGKPAPHLAPMLMREMLEEFGGLAAEIRETIVEPAQVDIRPLHKLVLPSPWFRGRVILIGDAVHLPTPQLGMGGAMAMEDGFVLGDVLAREETIEDALAAFMDRRFDRCRVIVNHSAQLSEWEKNAADHGPEAAALMKESHQLLTSPI